MGSMVVQLTIGVVSAALPPQFFTQTLTDSRGLTDVVTVTPADSSVYTNVYQDAY